ncbi:MAG: PH domain-containing protein [Chloroflexi bacterium]|nr:PH domain-containing protein [Chloroflexota bacterium]
MGYVEELLGKNEQIVVRTRKHWMVLAQSFVGNLVFTIVIVAVTIALLAATVGIGILALMFLFVPGALFLRDYLAWSNEEYLVTNQRVIQMAGVINKHVIDSSLEKVNDVVLDQSALGRIFNYGNIEILTASESGINKLVHIAEPIVFKTEMLNQKEALSRPASPALPALDGPEAIPLLIAQLDDLRRRGILSDAEFQQKKAELLTKM